MELRVLTGGVRSADAFLCPLAEGETPAGSAEPPSWLPDAPGLRDFRGGRGEISVLYGPLEDPFPRAVLVGLGKTDDLPKNELLNRVRKAAAAAARRCRALKLETLGVSAASLLRLHEDGERVVEEAAFAAALELERGEPLKPRRKEGDGPSGPAEMRFFADEADAEAVRKAVFRGGAAAGAVALAAKLADAPANVMTPDAFARAASGLAEKRGFACEILGRAEIVGLGMGAFAAVAAGSENEPKMAVLEIAPAGHEEDAPLVVVGKGICFDSGGICLKPSAGMREMKSDMSGAAAVLGLFDALGRLGAKRRVIGLMPCAENMPDAGATKPGDVVVSLSGKTIEIVNTDAEGRLLLCDALAYAQERWKPAAIVDVATLTGACVTALGDDVAGLFCEDDALAETIEALGGLVGEPFWRMPIHERYFESLKSEVADFANSGTRAGGACVAAAFLQRFVGKGVSWAHLDVAGPAFVSKASRGRRAGATGFAARTLIELATA